MSHTLRVVEAERSATPREVRAIALLNRAFDAMGALPGAVGAFDLIEDGIPALAAEVLRLRRALADIHEWSR